MLNLLVVALLLFQNTANSVEIQVLDANTKQPVSYVTVISPSFKGIASEAGRIEIPQNITDTIVFQCVGYDSRQLFLNDIEYHNGFPTVFLKQKNYAIEDVTISASRIKRITRGYYKQRSRCSHCSGTGGQVALFFPPEKKITGLPVGTVSYFIEKKANFKKRFRVRVYSVNPNNGAPLHDILPEAVYANAEGGNEWVTVRVRQYNIKFPNEGMFVALEFLPDSTQLHENYIYTTEDGLSLGGNFEDENNGRTWIFIFNEQQWKQDLPVHKQQYVGNAMIKMDLFKKNKK